MKHMWSAGKGLTRPLCYVTSVFAVRLADAEDSSNTFQGFLVQSRCIANDTRVGTFGVVNSASAQIGPCAPTNVRT